MNRNQPDISVILPTYNEKTNILLLIEKINELSLANNLQIECIVVDDNSTDGTSESIKQAKFTHCMLLLRKNERGLATAIRDGIKKASGKIIIVMDTDLNHDPKLIPELVRKLRVSSMVIGSRFIKGGGMDNYFRYIASKMYNKLFLSTILRSGVSDNLSGYFAMYRKDIVPYVNDSIFYGYGDYFIRLIYSLKKNGYKFIEVPCYYKNRVYGQSKSKFIDMLISYSYEAIKYVFNKK